MHRVLATTNGVPGSGGVPAPEAVSTSDGVSTNGAAALPSLGDRPTIKDEIHAVLRERGIDIAERSVTNLLDRYDELLATALTNPRRLRRVLKGQPGVILALDGLQPDVGHEVLWVSRDVLSGEVLLARSLLSSTQDDLAKLISEVRAAISVPIIRVVSDGQDSIGKAIKKALDGVPHQLCQFH